MFSIVLKKAILKTAVSVISSNYKCLKIHTHGSSFILHPFKCSERKKEVPRFLKACVENEWRRLSEVKGSDLICLPFDLRDDVDCSL